MSYQHTSQTRPSSGPTRVTVCVQVVDPDEMFIGGDDLRWVTANLDICSGRLALTKEARTLGWPIFALDCIELSHHDRYFHVPCRGDGPEPWKKNEAYIFYGVYQVNEIQEHGDSLFLDTTDLAYQRLCHHTATV